MKIKKTKFVIASRGFMDKKEAERIATGYMNANQFKQGTFLYKVIKVYRPKIKFEEIL